jgi:hypothetical protein
MKSKWPLHGWKGDILISSRTTSYKPKNERNEYKNMASSERRDALHRSLSGSWDIKFEGM